MPEDTNRTTGRDVQRMNIHAAKLVAEAVRTTLGPKGMDKMLVVHDQVTVTNDGVTILEDMQIVHPCAKMIVDIAKTQEAEVGDGTTTAVVLAGELLKNAEELLEQGIHPTVIAKGYRLAGAAAQRFITSIAKPVTIEDTKVLQQIARTAMTGKGVEEAREHFADIVVNAATSIATPMEAGTLIQLSNVERTSITTVTRTGGQLEETALVDGIVLEKERLAGSMPSTVENATIALVNTPIQVQNTEVDAKISITDPAQLQKFLDMEESMLKKMVEQIKATGASVVLNQKGIDDVAAHFFAQHNILALRRIKQADMQRIASATSGTIVTSLDNLTPTDLGNATCVEEQRIGEEHTTVIRGCNAATVLVRGSTTHVTTEAKRAFEDAIGDVATALKTGKIIAGAGAAEIEIAHHIEQFAMQLTGREQLAARAFAKSLEVIPRTLAENAGIDPVDAVTQLKAAHKNNKWAGINVFTGKTMDAWKEGVVEPLQVKVQALSSAVEVAMMILRIDDVIATQSNA
ncbi:MAG: thermosome subunit alpha [Candidatus Woesearchaeota archaeon]|nr:thermosome subunit alpha [Candidatus Woesearchaeota archaeon]